MDDCLVICAVHSLCADPDYTSTEMNKEGSEFLLEGSDMKPCHHSFRYTALIKVNVVMGLACLGAPLSVHHMHKRSHSSLIWHWQQSDRPPFLLVHSFRDKHEHNQLVSVSHTLTFSAK